MSAEPSRAMAGAHDRLQGIQLARGIAALLVVVYHTGRLISLQQYVEYIPFWGIFNFGHAGVDFFFVLSGFIILHVHHGDIGRPDRFVRYVWRRVSRIYPVYWLMTALLLLIALAKPGRWDTYSADYLLKSLLLLPQEREPVVGVAWTLVHEMLFYSVFALIILSRRLGWALVVCWALLVAATLAGAVEHPLLRFIGSFHHVQFLLGAIAATIVRRCDTPHARLVALFGALGFLAVGLSENARWFEPGGLLSQILFGFASMILIVGVATAERAGVLRVGRIGAFFGAASYSLYLIHITAIVLTARALMTIGVIKLIPPSLVFMLAAAVAIAAGYLLYLFAERPTIAILQRFGATHVYGSRAAPSPAAGRD